MRPGDVAKTAFSFERGHFEFTRMPFGLKNAPRTFQRMMDEFLRGIGEEFCQVYMDDIIVFSRSETEHQQHLRRVFDRAREFGVKLAEEKCCLARKEVAFLGHVVSEEGVRPDPSKVQAVMEMKLPSSQRGVRGLLGVLNYYRKFIPRMAHQINPLTNMLKKGAKVEWTAEAEKGVRECMKALTSTPVLAYPDFSKEFRIATDASAYALGAVLTQESPDGERPVAYASRKLTPAETRYSTIEREMLGIVWAVEGFRPYVYGRPFTIITDHKPLQWVGSLKETSARVSRWKERLAPYQYRVKHAPGSTNVVADWLSRAVEAYAIEDDPGPSTGLRQFLQEWRPEEGESETEPDRSRDERRDIEEIDDIINNKARQIRWKSKTTGLEKGDFRREVGITGRKRRIVEVETPAAVTKIRMVRMLTGCFKPGKTHYCYIGNEVIWNKFKELHRDGEIGEGCTIIRCKKMVTTVLDPERQRELIQDHHLGKTNHRGAAETTAALKRRYFWDGMGRMVDEVVKACETCCRVKAATRPPETTQEVTPTTYRPLQHVEMDTFTWRGFSWVTLIDSFSKLAMVERIQQRPAEAVLAALRQWCRHYGTPERITSDRGTEFRNASLEEEAKRLEVKWHFTTAGHTQGRACVERLHGTLSDHLRLIMAEQDVEIPDAMYRAVIAYNHSIHSTTGYSPIELVFGGACGQRDSEQTAPTGSMRGDIISHLQQLKRGWREARERLIEEKSRRVLRHNMRVTDATGRLGIGTVVYRRIPTNRRKEEARYTGPYKIVAILEHGRYTIESVVNPGRRRQVHLQQLKIPQPRQEPGEDEPR